MTVSAKGFGLVGVSLEDDERAGPSLGVKALVKRAMVPGTTLVVEAQREHVDAGFLQAHEVRRFCAMRPYVRAAPGCGDGGQAEHVPVHTEIIQWILTRDLGKGRHASGLFDLLEDATEFVPTAGVECGVDCLLPGHDDWGNKQKMVQKKLEENKKIH